MKECNHIICLDLYRAQEYSNFNSCLRTVIWGEGLYRVLYFKLAYLFVCQLYLHKVIKSDSSIFLCFKLEIYYKFENIVYILTTSISDMIKLAFYSSSICFQLLLTQSQFNLIIPSDLIRIPLLWLELMTL